LFQIHSKVHIGYHHIHIMLDLQLSMQSVPITTKVVSSYLPHSEVYSIQHYVIKFVSDLRQVGSFLWILQFPPLIKLLNNTFNNISVIFWQSVMKN